MKTGKNPKGYLTRLQMYITIDLKGDNIMSNKLTHKKTEQICKEYKDFIDSPFSDGYTVAYLENKFKMSIEDMRKVYEENRPKSNKLSPEELLKQISSLIHSQSIMSNGKIINNITELLDDNGYTE